LNALLLKNQLCFPLYAASREVIKIYKPLLDDVGLTYTQYITMMALWEHKSLSVKEIGTQLYLDSGTLTPLLKKLEADGFIKRTRSTSDERSVIINLTEKGEELKTKAAEIPQKVGACLPLSQTEALELYTLLYKILEKLRCEPFGKHGCAGD